MKISRCCPRASTRVPCAGIWINSIFFGHLIYYRQCLLRFESLCRTAYPHCRACSGHSDRDVYPPAIGWTIELVLIGSDPDQDLADDYPEIGESTCGDPAEEGCLIVMVGSAGGPSQNSSSRYPIIGRSEVSDAQTSNDEIFWNLNPDFNVIRF
jgi:hypothetical protein